MKSFTSKLTSIRGWALLLALLLGAGMMISACGEEEVPTPTTPAPAPPAPPPAPEPKPEPEPPAVPTGLRISASGMDFIEWSWTMVEGVSSYDVQYSTNEAFTAEDEVIARTAEEISYRRDGLAAGTSAYLRVRSVAGMGDDQITSAWSSHVTGMTEVPPPPEPEPVAPGIPTGFRVSGQTENSITWSWAAVDGAHGYVVQLSTDENFEMNFEGSDTYQITTATSYTATDLDPDTPRYARVAAGVLTAAAPSLDPGDYLLSAWTGHRTGRTNPAAPAVLPAPANVSPTAETDKTITWEWDAVAGADGYMWKTSSSRTFPGADFDEISSRPVTSVTIRDLQPNTTYYFRVRAYTGTVAARVNGGWSEPESHRTEATPAPPPPEPLRAPTRIDIGTRTRNSVAISWPPVTGAGRYEVQQDEGGGYVPANCDGLGGTVTDTDCVAGDLDQATSYTFQVRALPEDEDENARSTWARSRSVTTQGRAPVTGTGGDLGITWTSDADSIDFQWNPPSNTAITFLTAVVEHADPGKTPTNRRPSCPPLGDDSWGTDPAGSPSYGESIDLSGESTPAGTVRALCVRQTWEGDSGRRYGDPEISWASTVPALGTDATPTEDASGKTDKIAWPATLDQGFNYEFKTVYLPWSDPSDLGVCQEDGKLDETLTVNRDNQTTDYEIKPPTAYAEYKACARVVSVDGASASDWVSYEDSVTTTPDAPSLATLTVTTGTITDDALPISKISTSFTNNDGLPDAVALYDAKVLTWNDTDTPLSASVAHCDTTPDGADADTAVAGVTLDGNKFIVSVTSGLSSFSRAAAGEGNKHHSLMACVRGKLTDDAGGRVKTGPWKSTGEKRTLVKDQDS